ncbi:hypothetical protein ONE63_001406 [Megalurothrips usitatus]|uniref:Uncharacterized protein n=1 Tax=Megalurothrips usitatus TaxID=439358 RepID=A0AAV7XGN5_9NEOP|nr:hypothetical protein ONE63_001406 [Megalurothrips usitatus]
MGFDVERRPSELAVWPCGHPEQAVTVPCGAGQNSLRVAPSRRAQSMPVYFSGGEPGLNGLRRPTAAAPTDASLPPFCSQPGPPAPEARRGRGGGVRARAPLGRLLPLQPHVLQRRVRHGLQRGGRALAPALHRVRPRPVPVRASRHGERPRRRRTPWPGPRRPLLTPPAPRCPPDRAAGRRQLPDGRRPRLRGGAAALRDGGVHAGGAGARRHRARPAAPHPAPRPLRQVAVLRHAGALRGRLRLQ